MNFAFFFKGKASLHLPLMKQLKRQLLRYASLFVISHVSLFYHTSFSSFSLIYHFPFSPLLASIISFIILYTYSLRFVTYLNFTAVSHSLISNLTISSLPILRFFFASHVARLSSLCFLCPVSLSCASFHLPFTVPSWMPIYHLFVFLFHFITPFMSFPCHLYFPVYTAKEVT